MPTAGSVEERLLAGQTVWHWLHDTPEWGAFTLLFISLHRDGADVIAGLWEVWDQGTGSEDPVTFKSADPDRRPGEPSQWLRFPTLAAALTDLSVHGVSADGFGSRDDLVSAYGAAARVRPAEWSPEPTIPFAVLEMPDPDMPG